MDPIIDPNDINNKNNNKDKMENEDDSGNSRVI